MSPRRRFLMVLVALALLMNMAFVAWKLTRPQPALSAHFDLDETFARPKTEQDGQNQILILRDKKRWLTRKGAPIANLREYVSQTSAEIVKRLEHSHPVESEIPVFVRLGDQASIADFTDAVAALRAEKICWVGFDDLARTNHMPSGEPFDEISTVRLCE